MVFFPRAFNSLIVEMSKMNKRNCKIVSQVKATRARTQGWVLLRRKAMTFFFKTAELPIMYPVPLINKILP